MKLKPQHAQFLANRIVLDLSSSNLVRITSPLPNLNKLVTEIIKKDIQEEASIEHKTRELLEQYQDEIDDSDMNEKQLFAMVKKQVAKERGFPISHNERYSELSHILLDELFEEMYIEFNVAENVVKNSILDTIEQYLKFHEEAYSNTTEKMKNYKRKLIPGSDEYELIFMRLYEEELSKRG
ncbi:DUF507 domain-containing protein [Helicobacter didelphidarum]|uniref:DUF507 domain-containing protein n=1 Tax=Helicobacter didelphidarum TaxID=2040648 RepID=A0A3D8IBT9_9HELI|nr:DUF507 family protein [Helicobacter didelphidarum]RDU62406.1 DUF507 domain-containing protein [Helicobacter didelphidarum]